MNAGRVLLLIFLGIAIAVPAQPQGKWIVTYKGRDVAVTQSAQDTEDSQSAQSAQEAGKDRKARTTRGEREGFSAKSAAETLAKNMSKVLQREIQIAPWSEAKGDLVFLVTEAQFAPEDVRKPLQDKALDAFTVKYPYEMDGRKVCLLISRDNLGYDFPVYYFLRKVMGMEWVGPTELGEVYREQPDWQMPKQIDVVESPDYQHRMMLAGQANMDSRAWFLNGSRMMFHHSMNRVYDPAKYGDQPDLYPYINGKRQVPTPGSRTQWQPCTSNPKAVQLAIDFGVQYLKDNPGNLSFGLSVNDAGGFCLCDKCVAQDSATAWDTGNPSFTDRYVKYYNQVMEGVLKQNPNAWMAFLGYSRVQTPPTETKINPRIIVFNCMDNLGPIPDMAERQKMWKAAGATPALYLRIGDVSFLTIQHCPHALGDIIKLTKDLGGFGFYAETSQNWAASGPRLYVIANKLWDADANVDELLAQYMKLAFGAEAAPAVGAYFDRWEKIYERRPAEQRYDFMMGKGDYVQINPLTREDLSIMDAALEKAQAASASAKEKKRLEYVATYYKWLRLDADQYLLARELNDPAWIEKQSSEDIFKQVERGLAIADGFDRMTNEVILKDESGWLCSKREDPEMTYRQGQGLIRGGVVAVYKSAIDEGFGRITARLLKKQSKEEVAAYWREQSEKNPVLAPWASTQAHLLNKGAGKNLFANGDLEQGTPGDPLKIEGWKLSYSGLNDKPLFAWEPDSGRESGHSIAVGQANVAGIAQEVPIQAGKRYRFSVWYKAPPKLNPTVRFFIMGLPLERVPVPIEPAKGQWRQYVLSFSGSELMDYQAGISKIQAVNQINKNQAAIGREKKELRKLQGGKPDGKLVADLQDTMKQQEQKIKDKELRKLQGGKPDGKLVADLQDTMKQQEQKIKDMEAQLQEAEKRRDSTTAKISLDVKTLNKGEWMWLDDMELREISD